MGRIAIPSSPASVRILHLTDPHLFADRTATLRGTVTYSSLQRVLEHVQSAEWSADLVALTGDLVQDDSRGAYAHLASLVRTLQLPVLTVPGNHDVRSLMQSMLQAPHFDYCGSTHRNNWLIVGVDSCLDESAAGHVSDAELGRLGDTIAASDAPHVLICLHHPPVKLGSLWLDSVGLANGPQFLQAVARSGRVRAVLFGHAHQAFEATEGSCQIIGTPSTCRQFKVGSDEFALDDQPPAYRRIELHADGGVESALIWVADQPGE